MTIYVNKFKVWFDRGRTFNPRHFFCLKTTPIGPGRSYLQFSAGAANAQRNVLPYRSSSANFKLVSPTDNYLNGVCHCVLTNSDVQDDKLNIAVCFWYLIKSDLSSIRLCARVHWTCHIFGTRKARPCLPGHPLVLREHD